MCGEINMLSNNYLPLVRWCIRVDLQIHLLVNIYFVGEDLSTAVFNIWFSPRDIELRMRDGQYCWCRHIERHWKRVFASMSDACQTHVRCMSVSVWFHD